jgi:hypothetical protein
MLFLVADLFSGDHKGDGQTYDIHKEVLIDSYRKYTHLDELPMI